MSSPYLIFGSTGYIGRTLARKLVNQGHHVYLSSRNAQELNEISNELSAPCGVADVLHQDQIKKVVDEAGKENGLQGVAFCVGNIVLKSIRQAKVEDYVNCFNLNLVSAAAALKYSEPYLKKSSVVLFSTVAAGHGLPNHSVIASAKSAVEGLGKSLAAEWAPHIRVNVIAPSLTNSKIATPLLSNAMLKEKIAKGHPMQRTGEPEDVANLAYFLLQQENSWITGQVMGVDGGKGNLII